MPKISPFLWYEKDADKAAKFYKSVFKTKAKIKNTTRWGAGTPFPAGSVMSVTLDLFGHEYVLFNGGPHLKLTPAFSIVVHCKTQKEVDFYWSKLSAVPQAEQCGWCVDKFGLSWQIVPDALLTLMNQKDKKKGGRVAQAMMKMKKLDIKTLKAASDGK